MNGHIDCYCIDCIDPLPPPPPDPCPVDSFPRQVQQAGCPVDHPLQQTHLPLDLPARESSIANIRSLDSFYQTDNDLFSSTPSSNIKYTPSTISTSSIFQEFQCSTPVDTTLEHTIHPSSSSQSATEPLTIKEKSHNPPQLASDTVPVTNIDRNWWLPLRTLWEAPSTLLFLLCNATPCSELPPLSSKPTNIDLNPTTSSSPGPAQSSYPDEHM